MRRGLKLTVYGAALAVIAGGTLTWMTIDKTVKLDVDGRSRTVHTLGTHVRDALAAGGYSVGTHDVVTPAADAAIHDGSHIVLHRARQLDLTINGSPREIWTTRFTVEAALADLGYSTEAFSSVPLDERLPLGATSIEIRSPKQVTVKHDGTITRLSTTDATVGELLRDAGIELGELDRLSVPAGSAVKPGQTIVLHRVTSSRVTKAAPIPYQTHRQDDPTRDVGTTTVVSQGANGSMQVTYAVISVDGKPTSRTVVAKQVLKQPTTQVVKIGTHAVTPQQIAAQLVAARGWSPDEMNCLTLLWDHESSWQVHATNPDSGAYGIPQSLPASKMSSAGPDWRDNPRTQITWGLNYIKGVYGTPCGAWSHELDVNWY